MKKYLHHMFHPHSLAKIALVLCFASIAILMLREYAAYRWNHALSMAVAMDAENEKISSLASELETFSIGAREKMATLTLLLGLYVSTTVPNMPAIQLKLDEYAERHTEFKMLRYVDAATHQSSSAFKLKDEALLASLEADAAAAPLDEVVISGLEQDKDASGKVSRYVYAIAPVRMQGVMHGFLEVAVNTDHIFEEILRSVRGEEVIFLADHDGNYILSPAISSLLSKPASIFDHYPHTVAQNLFSPDPIGNFVDNGRVFSYRHINLPGIRQGKENDNFWVLASVYPERPFFTVAYEIKEAFILTAAFWLFAAGMALLSLCLMKKGTPHHI